MHEPAIADRSACADGAEHVESDLADLTGVSLAAMRGVPAPLRSRRLLAQACRPRSNAMGQGNPPGGARAE
ncbi:aldo/keto reductase [Streptomyces antimicrobicus]|uniref:Aldo/keto reductase n=1 Tax=Streptomyces antimicrobicus TaxID=2883108 RepID=A0ABS8B9Q0_9ACTN|nr:aldo/keto reductase [Streptomyces antimicrobicus]MCB5181261.1 aldo/keto reductase [Streptomyces antimicrobicus]